ncbi:MAG: Crp/Fnr family transcriptional regulator, partial [Actinomycetota bacterium]|nr:Crp/Fnr family transcriptional regulator [Actinomycetota bacterium]
MPMSADQEARIFSGVDVLEPLSQGELDDLARRLPDTRLEKGELLYRPWDRGESLFVIKEGRVRVYRTDSKGGEFTLEVLGTGTVFGEMSLGPRRLRTAHAEAVEPSLVASLRRGDLEDLIRTNPEVGVRLVRLLSERLRLAHNRLADFAGKGVPARLASLVLYLAEGEGVEAGEGRYDIPTRYTHERLGTMDRRGARGRQQGLRQAQGGRCRGAEEPIDPR